MCLMCDPGHYCAQVGLVEVSGDCDGGFYCTFGATGPEPTDGVTGDICPVGFHCPAGSATPLL